MIPLRTNKPWGYELLLVDSKDCGAKVLSVRAGCRISLQQHSHRHETWYGISGTGWVIVQLEGSEEVQEHLLSPGEIVSIPVKAWHRVEALTDLKFIEVVPKYEPNDIIRKDDDYDRT